MIIVFVIAGGLGLLLLKKMQQKTGLVSDNPQPRPFTPDSRLVGPAVHAVQPQIEMSRAAIVAAPVQFFPATTIVPDIGASPLQPGMVDMGLVPKMPAGAVIDPVKALDETQIASNLLEIGGHLSEAII